MFGEEHRKVTRRHELKPGDTFCYGPDRARFEVDPNGIDRRGHAYTKPLRDAAVYAVIPAQSWPAEGQRKLGTVEEEADRHYLASQREEYRQVLGRTLLPGAQRRWSNEVSNRLFVREAVTAREKRYEVTCQPNYVED